MRPPRSLVLPRRAAALGLGTAALAASTVAPWGSSRADEAYPARPVTLVVPWPAGGSNDLLARLVADEAAAILGQRIVVANRAGASGTVGSGFVARSPPDGHTLLWGSVVTHVLAPALDMDVAYDPVADFAPVSLLTLTPAVLLVNPSFPARDVAGLAALLRAEPGRYGYASPGHGTPAHLAGELLRDAAGVDMVHVPYQGSGPALTDVIGGHVPIMVDLLPSAVEPIRSGRLRPLAVTSTRRAGSLPDVPTLAEAAGLPGFEVTAWNGLFAPARTPAAVVDRLNAAARAALAGPAMLSRLADLGVEAVGSAPDELGQLVRNDVARWRPALAAIGAGPDR